MSRVVVYGYDEKNSYWICKFLLKLGYSIEFIENHINKEKVKDFDFITVVNLENDHEKIRNILSSSKFLLVKNNYVIDDLILKMAEELDVKIINEVEICSIYCENKIIAITGTNGKTTTVNILHKVMLKKNIPHFVCGKEWESFAKVMYEIFTNPNKYISYYILLEIGATEIELASNLFPYIALITTLSDKYIDRYKSLSKYYITKMSIYKNTSIKAFHIVNWDIDYLSFKYVGNSAKRLIYSTKKPADIFVKNNWICINKDFIIDISKIKINTDIGNIMASVAISKVLKVDNTTIRNVIYELENLKNNLYLYKTNSLGTFVDNSISDNIQSTKLAISLFPKSNLIFGGDDENIDLSRMVISVVNQVENLYIIGSSTDYVYNYFKKLKIKNIFKCYSLKKTFCKIKKDCDKDSITIISPGMYIKESYKKIGNELKDFIEKI